MIKLTQLDKDNYLNDGVIKINLVTEDMSAPLFETFIDILNKYLRKNKFNQLDENVLVGWDDQLLHAALLELRTTSPTDFGHFYNTINLSASLHKIFYGEELLEVVAQLLDTPSTNLCLTGLMMRVDSPVDRRNSLNWHQDSSYYLQNANGKNGLVCWAPMHEVNRNNGTLQFLKGSHKLGNVKVESSTKERFSEQREIDDSIARNFEKNDLVANLGDVFFLSMDIIHRSGVNQSDQFRVVAGARYHNMYVSDFHTGELRYIYL